MKLISTAIVAVGLASLAACGGGAANNAAAANNTAEALPPIEEPSNGSPELNEPAPLPPPADGNESNGAAGNSAGNGL